MRYVRDLPAMRGAQLPLLGSAAPHLVVPNQPADDSKLPCVRVYTRRNAARPRSWLRLLGDEIAMELIKEAHRDAAIMRGKEP